MPPKKPVKAAPAKKPAAKAAAPEKKSLPEKLPEIEVSIKALSALLKEDAENKIKDSGRWPLIIDTVGQTATFLRYQDVNFLNAVSPSKMEPEVIRKALLGAVRYGKPVVLDMMEVNMYKTVETRFDEIQKGLLQSILDKSFIEKKLFLQLVKPEDGDDYKDHCFCEEDNFKFFLLTQNLTPEDELLRLTLPIKVV
ncbi:hypothetical protein NP493_571g00034 [Ridgeia piscesae]|uniref:Uncharacterized protein n=1 Tax=Ridgeia piscesae TaxID=27915 RepID=A0AAD9KUS9_RIDPI|nr:hypothetical protein NP493_571g00034 [Ridgeia piscesae]